MKGRREEEAARAVEDAVVTDGEKEVHRNRLARFVASIIRTAAGQHIQKEKTFHNRCSDYHVVLHTG